MKAQLTRSFASGAAALLCCCSVATSPNNPDASTSNPDASTSNPDASSSNPDASVNPDAGVGSNCTTACDCSPGLACSNGRCEVAFTAVYCCDAITCPGGSVCQNPSGSYSVCPSDDAGYADDSGYVYPDAGQGSTDAGGCFSACDCGGGLACVNGQCIAQPQPMYCCDSTDCPTGFRCQYPNGTISQCGAMTDAGGPTCTNCASYFTCCNNNQCVDVENDPLNCGGCGIVCTGATPYCGFGKCTTPPCYADAGVCSDPTALCCGGDSCCGGGQLCCLLDGPVLSTFCYTPTVQQPTCPKGCPICP
jgi:hypothetical protein